MRSLRSKLCRGARLLAVALLSGIAFGLAQVSQIPLIPTAPPLNGGRAPFGQPGDDTTQDPSLRRAQLEAARKRNIDRQNKMVADSDKICALAQQLSDQLNKGGRDALSPEAMKKMDEIEKLARGVKDRMRSE